MASGRNNLGGINILYSGKFCGFKSELIISERTYYNPTNGYTFFDNYIATSHNLSLTACDLRILAFLYNPDSLNKNTRFYLGYTFTKFLWNETNLYVPIQGLITAGVEFILFNNNNGILDFGIFYDYNLQKNLEIIFRADINNFFEYKRNNLLRVQISFSPKFHKLFRQSTIHTPRYYI